METATKSESKYERLRKIGIGSYGVVFKCVNRQSGQIVAIKRYSEKDSDPVIRKIAMREVRMLRQLNHPNLIKLLEVFRRKRRLHLVFDYCELTVLDVIEKYGNSCPVNLIRKIVWQIVNGINYCHTHNKLTHHLLQYLIPGKCIHRDIKPENILINGSGVVKLCDFGFARNFESSQLLTSSSSNNSKQLSQDSHDNSSTKENILNLNNERQALTEYVATRWYRAPELLIGEIYYDIKIDIWALGCVAAELMRGEPVWPGKTDLDQLFMIKNSLGQLTSSQAHTLLTQNIYDQTNIERLLSQPCSANDSLERKLPSARVGQSGVNFVVSCLQMDPNRRPTSEELLNHSYIQSSRMVQFMKEANNSHTNTHLSSSISTFQHPKAASSSLAATTAGGLTTGYNDQKSTGRSNSQSLLMIANGTQQVPTLSNSKLSTQSLIPISKGNAAVTVQNQSLINNNYVNEKVKRQAPQAGWNGEAQADITGKPLKRPKQPVSIATGNLIVKSKEVKRNLTDQQAAKGVKLRNYNQQEEQHQSLAGKSRANLRIMTDQHPILINGNHKQPVFKKEEQSQHSSGSNKMISRKYSKSNSNLPTTTTTLDRANHPLQITPINNHKITGSNSRKTTNVNGRCTFVPTVDSSASSSSISEYTLNNIRSSSISFLPTIIQAKQQQQQQQLQHKPIQSKHSSYTTTLSKISKTIEK